MQTLLACSTTCRVREHGIRFSQEAGRLSSVSDMLLFNPGDVVLPRIVLYLNPGLPVSSVRESGQDVKFIRNAQVLLIDRELGAPGHGPVGNKLFGVCGGALRLPLGSRLSIL